jgi:hypothetical protein
MKPLASTDTAAMIATGFAETSEPRKSIEAMPINHKKRAYVKANCTKMTNAQMASVLGISPDGVKHYIQEMKLSDLRKKSPEYQIVYKAQRNARNKTMFKKGQTAHNTHPELKVVPNKKMGPLIKYQGRMMLIKHAVWIANHKTEIPKGMVVKSIDGNASNLAIDNLQLISKYENLMISCIHKMETSNRELFELLRAAANHRKQLKHQINEK